jgi:hypothetical protein
VRRALGRITGVQSPPSTRFNLSISEVVDITAGDRDALARVNKRECPQASCTRQVFDEATSLTVFFEMQVAQSLAGLRGLIRDLGAVPDRKTLVLVSGGLLTSDRVGGRINLTMDSQSLGRDAAAANLNLYVLHMDSSFLDAFSAKGRISSSFFRDSGALALGLDYLSGSAGGALFRVQSGTGDAAFDRVLRETAAYYLLGVEPTDADRDGQAHFIRVRVKQRGVTVRSRAMAVVPKR